MDNFKVLKEQKNQYNEIFGNILGSKKSVGWDRGDVSFDGQKYKLGGNVVDRLVSSKGDESPYYPELWQKKEYRWLLDGDYTADRVLLSKGKIWFSGIWGSGEFKGFVFEGYNSSFKGGVFLGENYNAPNNSFKISPKYFHGKTFKDNSIGILGKRDISKNVHLQNGGLELITIPIGSIVKVLDESGKEFSFKVEKRVDENDAFFVFVNMSNNKKITMPWEVIRSDYDNKGFLSIGKEIGLFEISGFGRVKDVVVILEDMKSYSFGNEKKQGDSLETPKAKIDFKPVIEKLPEFKMFNFPLTIDPMDGENRYFVLDFQNKVESGKITILLQKIKQDIKSGIITGYGNYSFLQNIFGDMGSDKLDEETQKLMSYLNSVVRYVFYRILPVKDKNGRTVATSKMAISRLRNYLNPPKRKINKNNEEGGEGKISKVAEKL